MKKIILIAFLYFSIAFGSFAQAPSDAYQEVVRIMKDSLSYTYDSTSNTQRTPKPDTTAVNAKHPGIHESFPYIDNPSPVVVLDGTRISMDELNKYKLKDIDSIQVLEHPKATAIYGFSARKGVILINTKN